MTEVASVRTAGPDLIPQLRAEMQAALDQVIEHYRERVVLRTQLADPVDSDGLAALVAHSLCAADELLVALPATGPTELRAAAAVCVDQAIMAGHSVRVVAAESGDETADDGSRAPFAGAGASTRTIATLPTWLLLVGSHTVILPARRSGNRPADALAVRDGGFPTLARWCFEQLWRASVPAPRELSVAERQVLRCLADNFKDERAARHLEMSVRTYRRNVTSLFHYLGAANRFEAGVKAAQAGLI